MFQTSKLVPALCIGMGAAAIMAVVGTIKTGSALVTVTSLATGAVLLPATIVATLLMYVLFITAITWMFYISE